MNQCGTVAIVVPVYKTSPDESEKASFLQLFSVLRLHPIYLITYKELDLSEYMKLADNNQPGVIYFDSQFFESIDSYSKLMCSPLVYKTFSKFKFILIYQLDAWVFRDELLYWCHLNYDYIGAPWFDMVESKDLSTQFIGVGNGGFSLRKVSSHLKALKTFCYITSPVELLQNFVRGKIGRFAAKKLLRNLFLQNNTHYLLRPPKGLMNEDLFWAIVMTKFKWFKAPDMTTASKFSLELNSERIYEQNGRQLPFGCHAWQVYEPNFWAKFIHLNN